MAIGSIEFQGQISRAQDLTMLKHNDDQKGMIDQGNFQTQFHKEVEQKSTQVKRGDDTENEQKRMDAKNKGNGQYAGDGGRKKKKTAKKDRKSVV